MTSREDFIVQQLKKLNALDTLSTKMDGISASLNQLTSKVETLQQTVSANTTDIAANKADIAELRGELQKNKTEVKALKTSHNLREQRLRSTTVRLFNFPVTIGESLDNYRPLETKVYEKIVRPAIVAAKAAGYVGSVSQQQNCIEACFRVFSPREPEPGSPLLPVIIRLSSNAIKFAVMKNRKHIPAPGDSEKSTGIRRFILVEDLTPEAHSLLKALQKDSRAEKVW